jgi:hypothetical protein
VTLDLSSRAAGGAHGAPTQPGTAAFEALTERLRGLFDGESRRIVSQLEQHTTGLTELHVAKVAAVGDRRYVQMPFSQSLMPHSVRFIVGHPLRRPWCTVPAEILPFEMVGHLGDSLSLNQRIQRISVVLAGCDQPSVNQRMKHLNGQRVPVGLQCRAEYEAATIRATSRAHRIHNPRRMSRPTVASTNTRLSANERTMIAGNNVSRKSFTIPSANAPRWGNRTRPCMRMLNPSVNRSSR